MLVEVLRPSVETALPHGGQLPTTQHRAGVASSAAEVCTLHLDCSAIERAWPGAVSEGRSPAATAQMSPGTCPAGALGLRPECRKVWPACRRNLLESFPMHRTMPARILRRRRPAIGPLSPRRAQPGPPRRHARRRPGTVPSSRRFARRRRSPILPQRPRCEQAPNFPGSFLGQAGRRCMASIAVKLSAVLRTQRARRWEGPDGAPRLLSQRSALIPP
jgi:hypothetical protein